jgi:hypothetical protein
LSRGLETECSGATTPDLTQTNLGPIGDALLEDFFVAVCAGSLRHCCDRPDDASVPAETSVLALLQSTASP